MSLISAGSISLDSTFKWAVYSDRRLATLFCVQKEFLTVLTCASTGYITLYFGGRGNGVSDFCDVASSVMYCIDAPQRIVTKSLYPGTLDWSTFLYSKTYLVLLPQRGDT